jgi:hypothetical protein
MAAFSRPEHNYQDTHPEESIEQAIASSWQAGEDNVERAAKTADAAAAVGDRTLRAGAEIVRRNSETVKAALQAGAELAARSTKRSADNMGRALGLSGDEAEKAVQMATHNIEAVMQSGTVMADIGHQLCSDWADFAHERLEHHFDRIDALMKCRTPHQFAALQSDMLRDHVEGFLGYARRVGEHAVRMADEATKPLSRASGIGERAP